MKESPEQREVPSKLEAVKKVFTLNPELSELGTEREYLQYLESVFPESTFREIAWHNSDADFKNEGFKPMNPNYSTLNSIEGIYNFSTNPEFVKRYGVHSYPVLLDVRKPLEDRNSGEYGDDMDRPISEALYKIGMNPKQNDFSPEVKNEYADCDAIINSISGEHYVEKHPVSGAEIGLPKQQIITVFNDEQIHILGSESDVERFKTFLSSE